MALADIAIQIEDEKNNLGRNIGQGQTESPAVAVLLFKGASPILHGLRTAQADSVSDFKITSQYSWKGPAEWKAHADLSAVFCHAEYRTRELLKVSLGLTKIC